MNPRTIARWTSSLAISAFAWLAAMAPAAASDCTWGELGGTFSGQGGEGYTAICEVTGPDGQVRRGHVIMTGKEQRGAYNHLTKAEWGHDIGCDEPGAYFQVYAEIEFMDINNDTLRRTTDYTYFQECYPSDGERAARDEVIWQSRCMIGHSCE